MDDNGNVIGINNARDLLERIPNKITDIMGIIADVNLLHEGELEYIEIIVENTIIVLEVPCVKLLERNWKERC